MSWLQARDVFPATSNVFCVLEIYVFSQGGSLSSIASDCCDSTERVVIHYYKLKQH